MASGSTTIEFTAAVDAVAEPAGETVVIVGLLLLPNSQTVDLSISVTSATLTINDPDTAPTFTAGASIDDQNYLENSPITALTLPVATGGNGALTYTLTPAIDGLSLDSSTGMLSGTPTTAATTAEYTYTATDGDDDAVTLTFNVVVAEDLSPDFPVGATIADQAFFVGTPVNLTLPGITAGTGNISITYTLTPNLPPAWTSTPVSARQPSPARRPPLPRRWNTPSW